MRSVWLNYFCKRANVVVGLHKNSKNNKHSQVKNLKVFCYGSVMLIKIINLVLYEGAACEKIKANYL